MDGVRESFATQPENTYLAGAWSIDFSHILIADALQLYHRQKGLANVNNLNEVVLDTWTGLKIPHPGRIQHQCRAQSRIQRRRTGRNRTMGPFLSA